MGRKRWPTFAVTVEKGGSCIRENRRLPGRSVQSTTGAGKVGGGHDWVEMDEGHIAILHIQETSATPGIQPPVLYKLLQTKQGEDTFSVRKDLLHDGSGDPITLGN
jgi:hypothetical protein